MTFTPVPHYDLEAGYVIVFFEDWSYTKHRVSSNLTLYRHLSEDRVIGVRIDGLREIISAAEKERDVARSEWEGMTLEQIMDEIEKTPVVSGLPEPYYIPSGDILCLHLENKSYKGVWMSPSLTLYRALDDDRVVGLCLDYVKKMVAAESVPVRS